MERIQKILEYFFINEQFDFFSDNIMIKIFKKDRHGQTQPNMIDIQI